MVYEAAYIKIKIGSKIKKNRKKVACTNFLRASKIAM